MTAAWSWRAEVALPEVSDSAAWNCSLLPAAEIQSVALGGLVPAVVSIKVDSASVKRSLTPP